MIAAVVLRHARSPTTASQKPGRVIVAVGLAAGLLLLGACGADDVGSTPTDDDLDGRTFVATDIDGDGIVEGSQIVIAFEDGTLVAQAGCNTQRTTYAVDDGVLVTGVMAATLMACDDALMSQDQLIAEIITGDPTLALDGDRLTIEGAGVTMTLTEQDRPLE